MILRLIRRLVGGDELRAAKSALLSEIWEHAGCRAELERVTAERDAAERCLADAERAEFTDDALEDAEEIDELTTSVEELEGLLAESLRKPTWMHSLGCPGDCDPAKASDRYDCPCWVARALYIVQQRETRDAKARGRIRGAA